MPFYDFKCIECSTTVEKLVKSDVKVVDCPNCGSSAVRQVSAPGGFNLQGDGFYRPSAKPIDPVA